MPYRRSTLPLLLLAACSADPAVKRAPLTPIPASFEFSGDANDDARLREALSGFLSDVQAGEVSGRWTGPDPAPGDAFLWASLVRIAGAAEPRVLKSYTLNQSTYRVTVAWHREGLDGPELLGVTELVAEPTPAGFRFRSPLDERTRDLEVHRVGPVTFRSEGPFDRARAERFVRTKRELEAALGVPESGLRYDAFGSLDGLLRAHGLVYDAFKCNDLGRDLGFVTDGGARYVTGMGDVCYLFGYVRDLLRRHAAAPDAVFGPYLNGAAAYFGGYGPSRDAVETLAAQFRAELERRPDIDFLAEFRKGRGASVERHFSHYVMCAFVCRAVVRQHGIAAALGLVESGHDGERFFERLEALLGVDEAGFHAFIVREIRGE